jgi:hypothetical protein
MEPNAVSQAVAYLRYCQYINDLLIILGVYGSAQGMAIAVHTPILNGTPVKTLQM